MELFSGIKLNSWENLAMNSTINCNISGATDVLEPYSVVQSVSYIKFFVLVKCG